MGMCTEDIDECKQNPQICHGGVRTVCMNNMGNYTCMASKEHTAMIKMEMEAVMTKELAKMKGISEKEMTKILTNTKTKLVLPIVSELTEEFLTLLMNPATSRKAIEMEEKAMMKEEESMKKEEDNIKITGRRRRLMTGSSRVSSKVDEEIPMINEKESTTNTNVHRRRRKEKVPESKIVIPEIDDL